MKKKIFLAIIGVMTIAAGCRPVPGSSHAPAVEAWTEKDVDDRVVMEEVLIPSAAPVNPLIEAAAPESCNYIHFLRFRLKDESEGTTGKIRTIIIDSSSPQTGESSIDAALLLMPGFLEGNNGFEYMGRQLVYMAEKFRGARIEVWALDRRPNCAEDLTGLDAAEEAKDTGIAIDYYWRGKPLNGHVFPGHAKSSNMPYLSEFGLGLLISDIDQVSRTMMPDRMERKKKLFVGGHSLAGFITAIYAGWDFDGNPETLDDAGFNNCAGFVALDTTISFNEASAEETLEFMPESLKSQLGQLEEGYGYELLLTGLRRGIIPRTLPLDAVGLSPEAMTILELAGMRAKWAPDEKSTLLSEIPYSKNIGLLLGLLHSKNLADFLLKGHSIEDFSYTNEALLGVIFDDNFMPISIMQSSLGFLKGGAVSRKDFPTPDLKVYLPGVPDIFEYIIKSNNMFIADDKSCPLYEWANFDEVATLSNPYYTSTDGLLKYTSFMDEVTDIKDFSRIVFKGPSNLAEWYFTMRFSLDMLVVDKPYSRNFGMNYMHSDKQSLYPPKIEFIAGKGPFDSSAEIPSSMTVLKGYNHFDVLTASANRLERRENGIFSRLIDFVLNPEPVPAESGAFSLLTYNVAGLPEGISSSHPYVNIPLISPRLNAFDIVLVQEDFFYPSALESQVKHMFRSEPNREFPLGDGLNYFSVFPFNNMIRDAWDACNGQLDNGSDCLTPKGFSYAVFEIAPGVEVDIYNLHMDAGGSEGDDAAREVQVGQLLNAIAERSAGRAIIVAGDTNLDEKPVEYAQVERIMSKAGLEQSCLTFCDSSFCQDCISRIDRIFYRSSDKLELRPLTHVVETERFRDSAGGQLSDHEAVSSAFAWKKR